MHPRIVKLLLALVLCTGSLFPAVAQTPAGAAGSTADQIAKLQAQVSAAQSGADNAWMLVSSALVLLMTFIDIPALNVFMGQRYISVP